MKNITMISDVCCLDNKIVYRVEQPILFVDIGIGFLCTKIIEERLKNLPVFFDREKKLHYSLKFSEFSKTPIMLLSNVYGIEKEKSNLNLTKNILMKTILEWMEILGINPFQREAILEISKIVIDKNFILGDIAKDNEINFVNWNELKRNLFDLYKKYFCMMTE